MPTKKKSPKKKSKRKPATPRGRPYHLVFDPEIVAHIIQPKVYVILAGGVESLSHLTRQFNTTYETSVSSSTMSKWLHAIGHGDFFNRVRTLNPATSLSVPRQTIDRTFGGTMTPPMGGAIPETTGNPADEGDEGPEPISSADQLPFAMRQAVAASVGREPPSITNRPRTDFTAQPLDSEVVIGNNQ